MSRYVKPVAIPDDMGGQGDVLDRRLTDVIQMLSEVPLDGLSSFLDVGIGRGQVSKWLAERGKSVTGTGIEIASYGSGIEQLCRQYGITVEDCSAEKMPFADATFDAVVMSHVLEHCPNVQMALSEVRRVLKDSGCLFVFVPPHGDRVCAGHISVGWNIGQLMYVLLLNGFDVKHGRFAERGYNVAAVVGKNLQPLPPLRCDRGDIHILNEHGLFPVPVVTDDGYNDNFNGKLKAVCWSDPALAQPESSPRPNYSFRQLAKRRVRAAARMLPAALRRWMSRKVWTVADILADDCRVVREGGGEVDELTNPSALR